MDERVERVKHRFEIPVLLAEKGDQFLVMAQRIMGKRTTTKEPRSGIVPLPKGFSIEHVSILNGASRPGPR